jgi:hypothetical protein
MGRAFRVVIGIGVNNPVQSLVDAGKPLKDDQVSIARLVS